MDFDTAKLCSGIITYGNDDARELVSRFVVLSKDFQNELRNHMDSKLEIARLKAENEFLRRTLEESENTD